MQKINMKENNQEVCRNFRIQKFMNTLTRFNTLNKLDLNVITNLIFSNLSLYMYIKKKPLTLNLNKIAIKQLF